MKNYLFILFTFIFLQFTSSFAFANPENLENILILENYSSDADIFQKALDNLDLTYTNTYNGLDFPYDDDDFQLALDINDDGTYDGNWDLIIFNYNNATSLNILDLLNEYVLDGGLLIMTYQLPVNISSHVLWGNLGFSLIAGPPILDPFNFEATDSSHELFTTPNTVNSLFTNSNASYTFYGHKLTTKIGAFEIANIKGNIEEAVIVINEQRKTIYNSIQAMGFELDEDSDGKLDIVELAENEISFFIVDTSDVTDYNLSLNIVYPNPSTSMLNIKSDDISFVELVNSTGAIVLTTTKSKIDLTEYAKGIYYIRITNNKSEVYVQKVIIK